MQSSANKRMAASADSFEEDDDVCEDDADDVALLDMVRRFTFIYRTVKAAAGLRTSRKFRLSSHRFSYKYTFINTYIHTYIHT